MNGRSSGSSCSIAKRGCNLQNAAPQKEERVTQEAEDSMPAPVNQEKSTQQQPTPKKRKKASTVKEERFDSPKIDTKGRYFVS